jgi:hypothetical protein
MSELQNYSPQPIDTSQVELPEDVQELTELLARNAHEIWARNRLAEGWRWGEERSDERQEHPCLVSYEELPESEKEFDRAMAVGTLKTITALGFQIMRVDK